MKLVGAVAVFVAVLFTAASAKSDTLTLSNGDRLTGSISDSDGKALTLKTEYAGDVKVKWSAIKDVSSAKPIYVVTSDRRP